VSAARFSRLRRWRGARDRSSSASRFGRERMLVPGRYKLNRKMNSSSSLALHMCTRTSVDSGRDWGLRRLAHWTAPPVRTSPIAVNPLGHEKEHRPARTHGGASDSWASLDRLRFVVWLGHEVESVVEKRSPSGGTVLRVASRSGGNKRNIPSPRRFPSTVWSRSVVERRLGFPDMRCHGRAAVFHRAGRADSAWHMLKSPTPRSTAIRCWRPSHASSTTARQLDYNSDERPAMAPERQPSRHRRDAVGEPRA